MPLVTLRSEDNWVVEAQKGQRELPQPRMQLQLFAGGIQRRFQYVAFLTVVRSYLMPSKTTAVHKLKKNPLSMLCSADG